MKRNLLPALLIALVLPNTWVNAAEKAIRQAEGSPNIILFLIDDMGLMDTTVPFVVDADGISRSSIP